MMTCRQCTKKMEHVLYGRLDDRTATDFSHHVASCPRCAAELERLQNAMALVEREGPPNVAHVDYDRIWQGIEARIDRHETGSARGRFWRFGAPLLAAALVLAFFGLLRTVSPDANPHTAVKPASPELVHYLDKTQPLLLAIANRGPGPGSATGFDHQWERGHASTLADEALALKRTLSGKEPKTMLDLLGDIELLLMQVANLNENDYESGIALVQSFMESRTILFKISLIEMRLGLT